MMLKFGLKNLRRLESVPPVELRPITLLVGRNSSGKSTFLRAFPLLRQSIMTRTSTPLLWYGDFVDFGSFQGSVFNNDLGREISFIFQLTDVIIQNRYQFYYSGSRRTTIYKDITLEVDIAHEHEASRISAVSLVVEDLNVRFDLRADVAGQLEKLSINNRDILSYFGPSKLILTPGAIFPDIIVLRDEQEKLDGHLSQMGMPEIIQAVADLIAPHLDKRIKKEAALELAMRLLLSINLRKRNCFGTLNVAA
ncbi:MAG: AAA family ATPase [Pseudolabrys sp.]|nr:AAA family ATPase [Pseudolabrys sp.]